MNICGLERDDVYSIEPVAYEHNDGHIENFGPAFETWMSYDSKDDWPIEGFATEDELLVVQRANHFEGYEVYAASLRGTRLHSHTHPVFASKDLLQWSHTFQKSSSPYLSGLRCFGEIQAAAVRRAFVNFFSTAWNNFYRFHETNEDHYHDNCLTIYNYTSRVRGTQ